MWSLVLDSDDTKPVSPMNTQLRHGFIYDGSLKLSPEI